MCMCVCTCICMRLYTCVCVCVCVFVHRLWVSVSVIQRVDGVMHAHVCLCTYVCVCILVWVYMYVHFFAVSVACTLEQVFWTLVHGQVCTLHRCVFTPTYTCANTLAAGCAERERDCFYYIIIQTYEVGLHSRRHPIVFTPTYTSANTLPAGCAHMCIFIHLCICMHMYMDAYVRLWYCLTRWGVVTKISYLCIRVHMHAYVYVCACMRV